MPSIEYIRLPVKLALIVSGPTLCKATFLFKGEQAITPMLSRAAFRHKYEQRITEPEKGLILVTVAGGVPRYRVRSALCPQG